MGSLFWRTKYGACAKPLALCGLQYKPTTYLQTHKHVCENRLQQMFKIAALTLWITKVGSEGLAVAAGEVKCLDLLAWSQKDCSSFRRTMT